MAPPHRHRKHRRPALPFEARLRIFCTIAALCTLSLAAAILALLHASAATLATILAVLLLFLLIAFTAFIEEAVRPIQTLANVVAALREEDYSFRARGASREDALGQLSLEINALADTLQTQRVASLEAVALLRRVIAEMDAPVFAFDQDTRLRLLNPAGERVFSLVPARDLGKTAAELDMTSMLDQPSDTVLQLEARTLTPLSARRSEQGAQGTRWMVRRSAFRQRGVPHTLVVLSDVSAALREEERLAWRRLIRVIGHEISNSLTPIKSIAGSLRARLPMIPENGVLPESPTEARPATTPGDSAWTASPARTASARDLNKGLAVIENR